MQLSIIGAAGAVGQYLATHLLRSGLLTASDRLQLVGHGVEGTERRLLAERCDLLDAFDETAPSIDVAALPTEVAGDVIVMAAGATVDQQHPSRRDLADSNRPVFETFATALARHGTGREVVVVVTNPVELGVEIFSRHLERHRVFGMGAEQDSLRFARAIASDARVHRDHVHAWVCGEHGEAQVPLWSSVQLLGIDPIDARQRLARMRGDRHLADFPAEIAQHKRQVFELVTAERIRDAFAAVEALPPDIRVVLEPFVTAHCLHSSPNATANATCDLIRAVRRGRELAVGAQVRLAGEFRDLQISIGLPVLVNAVGWSQVLCPPLADDEAQQLTEAAATITANLAQWLR
jgi:malate dehydrogenase